MRLALNGNNLLRKNIFSVDVTCEFLFSPKEKWICITVALVTGNPWTDAWLGDPPLPLTAPPGAQRADTAGGTRLWGTRGERGAVTWHLLTVRVSQCCFP